MDGAPACPFVAFGDDRDGRSTGPDHRHRCFAETPPAPRAVAHQEAYCLSSAFPVCPTFQDWARREAAHARGAGERAQTAPTASPTPAEPDLYAEWALPPPQTSDATLDDPTDESVDESIQRNPPRDWAAPPPWASGQAGPGGPARPVAATTGMGAAASGQAGTDLPAARPVEGQGLAGSPADRVAAGEAPAATAWSASAAGSAHQAPDEELASLVQGGSSAGAASAAAASAVVSSVSRPPPSGRSTDDGHPPSKSSGKRPAVSSTRSNDDAISGPTWERMRHYESYPPIKTRSGVRGVPRFALVAGAVGIAAIALFMLPALIGIGGGGRGSASASPSSSLPASTATAEATIAPGPTQLTYVIKRGDTLSKVANKFHVALADLLAANPDIKNPNLITLGQVIIIPTAGTGSPAATVKPSGSQAP